MLGLKLAGFAEQQAAAARRQARLEARAAEAAKAAELEALEQARVDNRQDRLLDRVGSTAWL